jgi:hypothetical protein
MCHNLGLLGTYVSGGSGNLFFSRIRVRIKRNLCQVLARIYVGVKVR